MNKKSFIKIVVLEKIWDYITNDSRFLSVVYNSKVIHDLRRLLQTGTNQSTNNGSYCLNSKER